MKVSVLVVLCLVLLVGSATAQHCPFDGAHLVVVHLTDSKGKPVEDGSKLSLREVDNPNAAACTYAEGLLAKPFVQPFDIFKEWRGELFKRYCKDCTFLSKGYYAVMLNQAEESCMMKKESNDFNYRTRKFEIAYTEGIIQKKVQVPKNRVYSLCTASGKWARIVPVDLKIARN